VFAGGTVYAGRAALCPVISNWRTTAADLDLLLEVVRELRQRDPGQVIGNRPRAAGGTTRGRSVPRTGG
jgi:hypothetical protein